MTSKMYAAKQIFKENNWSLVGCIQSVSRTSSIHYGIINVPINNIKMVSSRRHCSLAKCLQAIVWVELAHSYPVIKSSGLHELNSPLFEIFSMHFSCISPVFRVLYVLLRVCVCVCAGILDYTAYTINRCIHVCMECRWYFLLFRIANISN